MVSVQSAAVPRTPLSHISGSRLEVNLKRPARTSVVCLCAATREVCCTITFAARADSAAAARAECFPVAPDAPDVPDLCTGGVLGTLAVVGVAAFFTGGAAASRALFSAAAVVLFADASAFACASASLFKAMAAFLSAVAASFASFASALACAARILFAAASDLFTAAALALACAASAVACALTSFSASAAAFLSAAASALACAATTLSASLAADCSAHDTFVFSALAAWSPGIISLDHDNAQVYAVRCGSGVATLVCVFGGLYMYRDRMGGAIFGEKNFLSFSVLKKVLKFLIRIRRARAGKHYSGSPGTSIRCTRKRKTLTFIAAT